MQEYLNEFCYRFNRRFVEKQIPMRLLNLAIVHMPIYSGWAKCIGILNNEKTFKAGMKRKQKKAAMSEKYLAEVLAEQDVS